MIIVVGHLTLDATSRDAYALGCADAVRAARSTPGCLDFAVSADPVDDTRVNVSERWASKEQLAAFRGDGPDSAQLAQITAFHVGEFTVSPPDEPRVATAAAAAAGDHDVLTPADRRR